MVPKGILSAEMRRRRNEQLEFSAGIGKITAISDAVVVKSGWVTRDWAGEALME